MKKTSMLLLLLVFILLGCSQTIVSKQDASQIQKDVPKKLLELEVVDGGYNAYVRNAFDTPTMFSFAIQCDACDVSTPPPVLVEDQIVIPLDAKKGDNFTLIVLDNNNNFYASAKS
ncbi:hypothetical protein D6774_00725 [Candidatus Woesearchaeota archaeon]|jgi:uncharacterized lipoprotein|nr:MAG: hypothetical protein D6774_00725 [Candidatus Woesearchaeota archaeon]